MVLVGRGQGGAGQGVRASPRAEAARRGHVLSRAEPRPRAGPLLGSFYLRRVSGGGPGSVGDDPRGSAPRIRHGQGLGDGGRHGSNQRGVGKGRRRRSARRPDPRPVGGGVGAGMSPGRRGVGGPLSGTGGGRGAPGATSGRGQKARKPDLWGREVGTGRLGSEGGRMEVGTEDSCRGGRSGAQVVRVGG